MKPDFDYTPSNATDITRTWRKHGYKPTTQAERNARRKRAEKVIEAPEMRPEHVTPFARGLRAVTR